MYRGRGWRVEKRKVLLEGRFGGNYVFGCRDLSLGREMGKYREI